MPRGKDGKFTKEENFDLSLTHPFTIIKYLLIFIVAFPWYKFVTKTDILDLFYNKVVDCQKVECPKIDCSSCPTEKEVIIGLVASLASLVIQNVNHAKKKFAHLVI